MAPLPVVAAIIPTMSQLRGVTWANSPSKPMLKTTKNIRVAVKPYLKKVAEIKSSLPKTFLLKTVELPKLKAAKMANKEA